jgi:hypothetical protein
MESTKVCVGRSQNRVLEQGEPGVKVGSDIVGRCSVLTGLWYVAEQ